MLCKQSVIRAAGLLLCVSGLFGCNQCEKLVEKTCNDLGPEDCTYWKAHGGAERLIPGGRGVNKTCGLMAGDAVYPKLLKGQQDTVKAYRSAEAAVAKSKAK